MNIDEIKQLIEKNQHFKIVCLLGENPTTYSRSRIMWNSAFVHHGIDAEYIALDVSSQDLERVIYLLLNHDAVIGFNITNPYKELTAKLDSIMIDNLARIIGGVNTVHITESSIQGYSTDGYGAIKSLEEKCGENQFNGRNVVVLGAGGSGSAIAVACAAEGSRVVLANRDFAKAKALCDRADQQGVAIRPVNLYSEGSYSKDLLGELKSAHIVINTLPIEKNSGKPIFEGEELSGERKICMDIVYGHRSYFLELAGRCGHQCVEGQWMLLYQGVKAFEYMFQSEMTERGLTMPQIIAPMRYALNHFRFDEPNGSVQEKVLGAKEEIASKH